MAAGALRVSRIREGSSRSETMVPRGSLGSSIGCIVQLGAIAAVGEPQVRIYKVRKEDAATLPPGAGIVLRDETFGTSNNDSFVPEVVGTLERRALQKIDLLAQLVADPAAELVYSCEPRGNRGPILLRYLGSPAVLPLFGFVASDIEKRSPAVFHSVPKKMELYPL